MLATLTLLAVFSGSPVQNAPLIDSPNYFNKVWRDSVEEYRGRVEAYHQEFYSYNWAMTAAMLPVVGQMTGEMFVDKLWTGIAYTVARTATLGTAVVGGIRLIGGKPNTGLNIGLLVGGIACNVLLKWLEISDVMHTVSHLDEDLVAKWRIEIPDITPGSIRYPTKQWPDWITQWPPEQRHPERAREAVDKPLPMSEP